MENNINEDYNRQEFLFQHLIAMFQTLALQQLGKLINPMTGETERDLNQARITIDMIDMIREKTRGNLNNTEKQVLDKVLTELQMNYVTEKERKEEESEGEKQEKKEESPGPEDNDGEDQEEVSEDENGGEEN
ncbi:MAG: DUF1844 domain-containing protein [Candidatus Latescibacteria bacterium]|nr:DUF1844 domain-containing protein [bacterium]MBD3423135.1 DUF1844 domain-containing protein [Candidatus Latescibacterota bacterium]